VVDGVAQNTAFTNTGNISAYSQTSGDGALAIATGLKVSVLDGNIINSGVISGAASAGITQPDGTYSGSTTAQYYGYSVHIDDTVNSSVAYSLMNNLGGTLDGALKVEPSNIAVTNAGLVNTHEYLSNVAGNYTQTNTGMLNVDVRLNDGTGTVGGLNVGNPLRTNTVTAGGSTFDYGSLSVGGNAAFGTGNQFRVTAYGVCGVYNTDANCLATKSATEGALNAAASTPVVLNGVVTAGALKNLAGNTLSSSEVSSMVVTDNMLSVQFAAVLDGSNIDLVATQTNMTTVPNLANQGDLRSANGAAPLLDRLMTGPWLSQQQNIAYQSGSGTGSSTYGSQNGNSVVQQYLYYLGNSNNVTQASNKLQEALPLVTGGVSQATMGTLHSANGIIQSRQDSQSGMSSGDLFYGDKSVWFKPFGSWSNQDKKDGANGYNADTYGLAFGADGELSEANSIGLSFMYANSDVRGKIANPRADVDSYLFTVYGAHNFDESNVLSYQASAGWNDVSGSRPIVSTLYTASSNYTSRNYAASASLAHVMDLNETTKFVPSVKLAYARTHDDAYNETGAGGMDQHVDKATREEFVLSVDGKLNHPITESIMASANLGLGYDFIGDRASTTSYYIGDISGFSNVNFVTSGIKPSQWLGRFGLGLTGNITDTLDVNARYDLEVRDSYDNQTASVKVRYKF
jgi:outer membrane autotransporter protein